MNAGQLLLRRSAASAVLCHASRSSSSVVLRLFTSTAQASFQSYTLPTQPTPTRPRNTDIPETSIAYPVDAPPLPRVHETRPPPEAGGPPAQSSSSSRSPEPHGTRDSSPVLSEREAQQSRPDFVAPAAPSPPPTSSTTAPTPPETPPRTAQAATSTAPTAAAAPAPRKSKLRAPRKAAMKLTPAAVERVRALLEEKKMIKVGVRNRGCSGLAYHLEYVDKPSAFDETVEQDGVKVLIDSKALFSIIGSEMDYVEDKLSQRFTFRNPNIKEECGCGESFMV